MKGARLDVEVGFTPSPAFVTEREDCWMPAGRVYGSQWESHAHQHWEGPDERDASESAVANQGYLKNTSWIHRPKSRPLCSRRRTWRVMPEWPARSNLFPFFPLIARSALCVSCSCFCSCFRRPQTKSDREPWTFLKWIIFCLQSENFTWCVFIYKSLKN
jgi:hypothetical protein